MVSSPTIINVVRFVKSDTLMQIFGRRNSSRQGALSKQGDGVVSYVEPKRVEEQRSIGGFMRKSSLAGEIRQDKAERAREMKS
jgi:hypothetical protein